MPNKSADVEPNVVHEILRHVRDFSYLRFKELLVMFKETVSEWIPAFPHGAHPKKQSVT